MVVWYREDLRWIGLLLQSPSYIAPPSRGHKTCRSEASRLSALAVLVMETVGFR